MRRLVLAASATRDDLLDFFHHAGWIYIQEHAPTEGDPNPHTIGWCKGDQDEHKVHFVAEREFGVQYFVLESREPGIEELIESRVRGGPFKFLSREEIVGEFEAAVQPNDLIHAFAKLVLVAPEKWDSRFNEFVQRILKHQDPMIRADGLGLVTYLTWPELKTSIEELMRDPDERVRTNARTVMDGYEELGIGRGNRPPS